MQTPHTIESARLHTQTTLDAAKTHAERNRLGQFATPPRLALEILRQSTAYCGEGIDIRFLDPAFGTGAFYSALLQTVPRERIEFARGIEIDPHYGEEAKRLWSASRLQLQIRDFFSVPVPHGEGEKSNLIVCNPPYVRHHHLSSVQKEQLGRLTARAVGLRVNGLSGLYCYFLMYAHDWLAEDGIGCWLVPSEFMDVNYGAVVRDYLLRKVTLLRVHRFDPAESQFDDALVSSSVLWFRKSPPASDHKAEFTFGGSFANPHMVRSVSLPELAQSPKWTRFTSGHSAAGPGGPKLSDLFEVKRGLATGDNKFFILTKEDIERHKLPREFLIPILPSPRYLAEDVIEADESGNPVLEKQLFLLSCKLQPHEVKKDYPRLWEYLESGRDGKIQERYLCLHRSPWYAQENRPASPFLCTYMGRSNSPKGSPFRFILNHSKATAANVYLLLYPKAPLKHLIERRPGLARIIWEGLGAITPESLVNEGRVYGGGLHKMEPKELANAPADSILTHLPELSADAFLAMKSASPPELFTWQ